MGERQGKLVWHELLTRDPKRGMDFYTRLLGWTVQQFPMGEGEPYYVFNRDGQGVAGCMKMPADAQAPSHWLLYMLAESADDTHANAVKLGAKSYVPPTDIPTVGRFAVMADPQGATIAILQPESPEYIPDRPAGIGEFSWHELASDDAVKGFEFYSKVFGWEKRDAHDMGPMGVYQLWSRPGTSFDLGGMMNRVEGMPPSSWTMYIRVPSVDEAAPKVTQLGGTVIREPMEVPGGDRILIATDPTGAVFALHSTKA